MGAGPGRVHKPHEKLAEMMSRELDVSVNSTALRLFLKCHWSKISLLAHAIHGEGENG